MLQFRGPPSTAATATPRPSTPVTAQNTPSTPTGTWRHPKFEEIARRQNASTFTDRNAKKIIYNGSCLVGLWMSETVLNSSFPSFSKALAAWKPYPTYAYLAIHGLLMLNIVFALLPLIRKKDDLSDIALTPAQRQLLGLPPSSAPPTPGSQYITPPRFPRSSTPQSGSPGSNYSKSPLSGKGSPAPTTKGSPFSPSPLLHKAIGGGLGGNRRSSYGSPSPLGPGGLRHEAPGTPSPSTGKGGSVSLNNKWLYEKGRTSGANSRLFS